VEVRGSDFMAKIYGGTRANSPSIAARRQPIPFLDATIERRHH